jgi:hypothetical protein
VRHRLSHYHHRPNNEWGLDVKSEAKKQMLATYKERVVLGGVYAITNTFTGKKLVEATQSLAGSRNRFEFSQTTGSAVSLRLQADWNTYGAASFTFEVLEELEKGETQTPREFANDLKTLKEMWLEKGDPAELY